MATYHVYCGILNVSIPAWKFSLLSRGMNSCNTKGCKAAIKVNELAATPGVFEKVSIVSPITKAHNRIATEDNYEGKEE